MLPLVRSNELSILAANSVLEPAQEEAHFDWLFRTGAQRLTGASTKQLPSLSSSPVNQLTFLDGRKLAALLAPPFPELVFRKAAKPQGLGTCGVGGVALRRWDGASAVTSRECPERGTLRGGPAPGATSGAGPGRGRRRRKRRESSSRSCIEAIVRARGAASAGLAGVAEPGRAGRSPGVLAGDRVTGGLTPTRSSERAELPPPRSPGEDAAGGPGVGRAVAASALAAQGVGGGGMRRGACARGREALPAALPFPLELLVLPCLRGPGRSRAGRRPGRRW